MGKTIGIDLGTTNSVVSVMENDDPKVIENEEGSRKTPSIVAYKDDGERLVGNAAKRQAITNSENTISSIKRFMGRKYDDVSDKTDEVSYEIIKDESGMVRVKVNNRNYTPQEISSMVLQKLKKTAEDYLGQEVTDAVITVPAYFNDAQRTATKEAGKIAGLNVQRIINEPTAASLAYGLDDESDEIVAVYDLGGGTFDISILELGGGVFEVLATYGDTNLGGDDFDNRLMNYIADQFEGEHGVDLRKDPMALQRLREAAEQAKIELSNTKKTNVNLPFVTATDTGPKHLDVDITRADFEQLIEDLVDKTIPHVKKVMGEADLNVSKIDEVILVGGSTRIPIVQEKVKGFFEQDLNKSVNPDEVVSLGAAIQAGVLSGDVDDVLLLDVTPLGLGIETMGGVMTELIESNTTIPTQKTETFTTAQNNQSSVEVHVLQGDRQMAKDNRTIGRFHLTGIPPAPRGTPKIEVTFDIDADGILNVSAEDQSTGKKQSIEIEASSGLTEDEIERMKEEAEKHAEEDERRKERADTINEASSLTYTVRQGIEDYGDQVSDEKRSTIEEKADELDDLLKDASADGDVSDIESKMNELQEAWQSASQDIYSAQDKAEAQARAQANQAESTSGTPHGEEDVKDADYEVVDE